MSISTDALNKQYNTLLGLNPFMNQVYFYAGSIWPTAGWRSSLNPFMNQVYFYLSNGIEAVSHPRTRLNPFMNQVYFYTGRRFA